MTTAACHLADHHWYASTGVWQSAAGIASAIITAIMAVLTFKAIQVALIGNKQAADALEHAYGARFTTPVVLIASSGKMLVSTTSIGGDRPVEVSFDVTDHMGSNGNLVADRRNQHADARETTGKGESTFSALLDAPPEHCVSVAVTVYFRDTFGRRSRLFPDIKITRAGSN